MEQLLALHNDVCMYLLLIDSLVDFHIVEIVDLYDIHKPVILNIT